MAEHNTVPTFDTSRTSQHVLPVGLWSRVWLRIALSIGVAAAVIYSVMLRRRPKATSYQTDIVGYPSYNGFDVGWYLRNYLLWVLAFPMLVLVVYVVIGQMGRIGRWFVAQSGSSVTIRVTSTSTSSSESCAGAVIRVFLLAAVFAVVSTVALSGQVDISLATATGTGVLVAAALGVAAVALQHRGLSVAEALAMPVAIASPLTLIALWWAATNAEVVRTDGVKVPYPFVPLWLALPIVVSLIALLLWRLRPSNSVKMARRFVVFVVVPVLIFASRSRIPGSVGPADYFHHGELIVGAELLRAGEMPWRDFLAIHGLMQDSIVGVISFAAFEPTWWGFNAGSEAIFYPLALVSMYLLLAVLFERSWAFLTLCVVILISGPAILGGFVNNAVYAPRFILAPVLVMAFILLLRKPTWSRSVIFSGLLIGQFVITPESAYFIPAFAGALVAFEFVERDRSKRLLSNMTRTRRCLAVSLVIVSAFMIFLISTESLDDFVYYFRTFARDHDLTGGIPVVWSSPTFVAAAVLSPVAVVTVFAYVVWRIRSRRRLHTDDWALVALSLVVAVYYTKFLYRADGHVFHPLTLALPLLFAIVHRLIVLIPKLTIPSSGSSQSLMLRFEALLVLPLAVVLLFPGLPAVRETGDVFRSLSIRYHPAPVAPPVEPKLGYAFVDPITVDQLLELRSTLSALPGDASVFDFTNQPFLYHFLLDEAPVTRYYHISMAIRSDTQDDLIEQLESASPTVVVMNGGGGLPGWDGISNTVRHYDVSEWIIQRYRPWIRIQQELLYLRKDVVAPDGVFGDGTNGDDLYFGSQACSWGRAAESLSSSPADSQLTDRVRLSTVDVTGVMRATGWAVDVERNSQAEFVVALLGERVLASTVVAGTRPDVAETYGLDADAAAAFDLTIPLVGDADATARKVSLVAIFGDGSTRLVAGSPGSEVPLSLDFLGTQRLNKRGSVGQLEETVITLAEDGAVRVDGGDIGIRLTRAELPIDHTTWDWLFFRSELGLANGTYTLSDQPNNPLHTIQATVAERSLRLPIQVGSCPQWAGFRADFLYISTPSNASPIVEIARAPL